MSEYSGRLGKSLTFHGLLSTCISEVKWDHEIPDAEDGILRRYRVTLEKSDPGVPEGFRRLDVFFEDKQRAEIEPLLGQEVVLECTIITFDQRGFAKPISHREQTILLAVKEPEGRSDNHAGNRA